jgi:hypothetical protein
MRATLEAKVAAAGFASADESVADVLADDHDFPDPGEPHFRTRAEFEKLVREGLASGVSGVMGEAFWARMKQRVRTAEAK